jgi:hypothetical protein
MRNYSVMLLGAMILAGGCGKKEETQPAGGGPPPMKAGEAPPATAVPNPPLNPPKGEALPMPQPGQAGDHSSPAFKDGGKTDTTKN